MFWCRDRRQFSISALPSVGMTMETRGPAGSAVTLDDCRMDVETTYVPAAQHRFGRGKSCSQSMVEGYLNAAIESRENCIKVLWSFGRNIPHPLLNGSGNTERGVGAERLDERGGVGVGLD